MLRLTAKPPEHELPWMLGFIALAVVIPPLLSSVYEEANKDTSHSDSLLKEAIQFVLGLFFAAGLITSGMVNPEKVIRFLDLSSPHWDPSLLFVFIGALPLGIVGFRPMLQGTKPVLAATTSFPTRTDIDMPLIIGAILFGIGWGAAGVCPGPALVQFGAHLTSRHTIGFVLTMILGSLSCSAVQ